MSIFNSNNGYPRSKRAIMGKLLTFLLVIYDIVAVSASYFFALWLRFDGVYSHILPMYLEAYYKFIPIYTVFTIVVFFALRLYKSVWRYAGFKEITRIILATIISFAFHVAGMQFFFEGNNSRNRMPITYYALGITIQFLLVALVRFSYKFFLMEKENLKTVNTINNRVMLIGAGNAGAMILRDINQARETKDKVVCIIDDNPNKWNKYIENVPIIGGRNEILLAVQKFKIDKIYLAIPSASKQDKREILNICNETSCELKNLPGIYQFVTGEITAGNLKDVEIEDLLGRNPITVNLDEVFDFIQGKTILVTGGGGSIGSELCRQIAAHSPKKLIIFDVYENNAYDIEQELKNAYPCLDLSVLIGSVRDSRKLLDVFGKYKPEIVYHAAAHKHVPLMETSPCEAIKNNAIGTYKTAFAAMVHGCKRFVLISTDKAVNPTNIMGASKRLCEMVVQSFDMLIKNGRADEIPLLYEHYDKGEKLHKKFIDSKSVSTEFVAVRFGNVLGSNGSVIPIFKRQIKNGGPITVTHPDIIRYFMTIPEAVSLVLQAGTYAKGGEIFVLDMGAPVKIDTLARNLIRLSGLKPDIDIKIEYTGLRPGEKLYEEKLMAAEGLETTPNKLIHICKPLDFSPDKFISNIHELMEISYSNNDDIREYVSKIVPTYKPAGIHGCEDKPDAYKKQIEIMNGN